MPPATHRPARHRVQCARGSRSLYAAPDAIGHRTEADVQRRDGRPERGGGRGGPVRPHALRADAGALLRALGAPGARAARLRRLRQLPGRGAHRGRALRGRDPLRRRPPPPCRHGARRDGVGGDRPPRARELKVVVKPPKAAALRAPRPRDSGAAALERGCSVARLSLSLSLSHTHTHTHTHTGAGVAR
jgi:hypothetical protein